ncbi:transcriptional regulator, partial [Lachnospiraceae bacterium JC7]
MATERFEKLSEDKKKRILLAAREEFARVPYEEASINQIIKNAGISRGSFYTYFEDKNDLLQYVFSED